MNTILKRFAILLMILLLTSTVMRPTSTEAWNYGFPSAQSVVPSCKYAALNPRSFSVEYKKYSEKCILLLKQAINDGPSQPASLSACVPSYISTHNIAMSIINFLEKNPNRQNQRFDILAALVLHNSWPCQ